YGKIVVLGGNITIKPGAFVKKIPIVVTTPGYLVAPVIIGALFLLGAASLVVVPVLFWVIGHLLKKTQWYSQFIKLFQSVQRRWPAFYILTSFAISALMLTAFSTLAWKTMFRRSVDLFDDTFIWIVRYFASVALDQVMIIISLLGSGLSYIIILVTAIFLLGRYRRWLEIGALTICLSGGAALNLLLKHLFQRARPDMFQVIQESGYSFPSGHAMASVYFYGMAAFLIMRTVAKWRWRLVVATLAVFLIIAIGISRIYLGVHYPSDVIAGYAAGSMWLAFCISFLMWWEQQRRTMEK
ncbi:MAG: phosphatase PAP2 family protein, partial [Sporomusa sp.]